MSAVAIIPARGGSQRIPRKNIRPFMGKPIIAYSIEAARESGLFDAVYVSTDDAEIAIIARGLGARPLARSVELSRDEVGTQEVMRGALEYISEHEPLPEYACCIYATAPMMTAADLRAGFDALKHWPYVWTDGWFYWGQTVSFLNGEPLVGARVIPSPRRYIDINTLEDWTKAEAMYAALHKETA